jgi:hypothetical protein
MTICYCSFSGRIIRGNNETSISGAESQLKTSNALKKSNCYCSDGLRITLQLPLASADKIKLITPPVLKPPSI